MTQALEIESRIAALEAAIRLNREAKKGAPDCPCWGNAPQLLDAELFRVLDVKESGETKLHLLEEAIRHHRQEKDSVPECTCWVTQAAKADAKLYALLPQEAA